MMKLKAKENIDMVHVNQTAPVKEANGKLVSLRHQRDELKAKVSRWAAYFNPHVDLGNWTEEELWEAEINFPTAKGELGKLNKRIKPLEAERDRVYEAEKNRIRSALDDQLREKLARLAVLLEEAGNLNKEVYDLEQSYATLGCGAVMDNKYWPELMPNSTPTWTPLLPDRLQSWRENGWLS